MLSMIYTARKVHHLSMLYQKILKQGRKSFTCNCQIFKDFSTDDISAVSSSSVRQVLIQQKIKYEEKYTCLLINCPICCDVNEKGHKSSKTYINKTTGYFSCQCGKYAGLWKILETYLSTKHNENIIIKDAFKDAIVPKEISCSKSISANTKQVSKCSEEVLFSVCDRFDLPKVPSPVLNLLNMRIDESQSVLYIPLLDLEGHTVGYRVLDSVAGTEVTWPPANCTGLVMARATRSRDNAAVLVPSLADVIVLLESRVPATVICLPYGFSSLPQSVLPGFEKFTKLILWFGNDAISWDTARSFAKKLGEKRCFFVRPTDKQPLPRDAKGHDLRAILTSAQPIWHKSITTFSSLRQDVLSDLQNFDKVQGIKWKRFPTLNKILKGHRRGELTVITGPTGCGKTTFISEYSLDLAMQQVNTLWGSFEIRNARLARTMLQQMSGVLLDEHLDRFDEYADAFEKLPIYFMTFHGQQTIKVVMEAVEHATYVHDIAHVIIDNVQFMIGLSDESRHSDRFWKQDAIVAAFRTFATKKNCHVTLVIHPRKERDTEELTTSSIFGGAKASQEADNVLIIQDKRLTSIRGKKYLQVAKNRYSGDLGIMQMDFDKISLSYAQKKKKISEEKVESQDVHRL